MTSTRKSLWSAVCVLLVLGLVIVQAGAAEPPVQKGKKPPGTNTDIPAEFNFLTFPYTVADIQGDSDDPYTHGVEGVVARMGTRSGAVTLETKDGPRGLLVDFWDQYEPAGSCDFGVCERPLTVPPPFDPVFVPENNAGMFLRIGNNVDLRDLPRNVPQPDPLHIRINTSDRDYIYLKYYPATDHKKSLCPILSEEEGETVYAQVTRLSDTVWQVEGMTARVEEYFGNKGHCRGYANMPVIFTITLLQ